MMIDTRKGVEDFVSVEDFIFQIIQPSWLERKHAASLPN